MTSSQIKSFWGTPSKKGKQGGSGRKAPHRNIDPAKRKTRDRAAAILKDYLGIEGFLSVRERGDRLSFVVGGKEVANADAGAVDRGRDADKDTILHVQGDNGLYEGVSIARMSKNPKSGAVSHLEVDAKKKCWIVKSYDDNYHPRYTPYGVAFVNGKARPMKERAARKFVVLWVAGAMTPNGARKDGNRVKVNIRTKDGEGTRYIFRLAGKDMAEFYHDGRFNHLGMYKGIPVHDPFEAYLKLAGIPCVDDRHGRKEAMAKLAELMVSPGFASGVDETPEADYDDDDEFFKLVTAKAVELEKISKGDSLEDYHLEVDDDRKPILVRNKRKPVDVPLEFGGGQSRRQGNRPRRANRKAGKRSAAARPTGSAGMAARAAAAPRS